MRIKDHLIVLGLYIFFIGFVGQQLTKMEMLALETQYINHFFNLGPRPNCVIIWCKKDHLVESSFDKALDFFFL